MTCCQLVVDLTVSLTNLYQVGNFAVYGEVTGSGKRVEWMLGITALSTTYNRLHYYHIIQLFHYDAQLIRRI